MFYLSTCKFRIFDCSFTWLNIFIKSVLRNKGRFNMNRRGFCLKIFLFCYLNKKLSSQNNYAQHLSLQMWNSRTHVWSQLWKPSHLSWHLKFRVLTSLDISDVDTVWTWWGQTSPPQKTGKTRDFEKKLISEIWQK